MTEPLASESSRTSRIVTAALVLGVAFVAFMYRAPLARWLGVTATSEQAASAGKGATSSDPAIDHYTCSMHPSVEQPGPGKCPICGMDLTPVTRQQQAEGVVWIDDARRQLIGVRTAAVTEAPLHRVFSAAGRVAYDEGSFTDVNLRVSGWITKLLVNETGQRVARGQTLFTLYSPDLFAAQQDFLAAQRGAQAGAALPGARPMEGLVSAARKRLLLLGLSEAQLNAIAADGQALETVPIASPANGFVIEKDVVEGASVQAGMRLFRIAALDRVWVEADVYAGDLPHVRAGQPAKVTLDYLPDQAYEAKVAYVYPYLESEARTGRVRVELDNKALALRPGMYARVELADDLGTRLQVPASAVVYTGPQRLVFVDLGDGRFKPQAIRVGIEADGNYEVLDGLKAGDIVATSGTFLIAAEARISTAATYWESDAHAEQARPAVEAPIAPAPAQIEEMPAKRAAPRKLPPVAPQPTQTPPAQEQPTAPAPAASFTCPMHPEVHSDAPGDCPKCGMPLVPAGAAP